MTDTNMTNTKKLPEAPRSKDQESRNAVIALRKTCDTEGTGLSHFVLMDKASRKAGGR